MTQMYCECGCGRLTSIAKRTRSRIGHVKGQPVRFLVGHAGRGRFGPLKQDRYVEEDLGHSTPCWVWKLAQIGKGYGCEWDGERGRMVGAHILAYERVHGKVPEGLELDHLCGVRLCVNPAHLEAVTHAENIRRGAERGSYRTGSFNASKTHCPRGHPYAGDNLMVEKSGARKCRQCVRANQRDRRSRT